MGSDRFVLDNLHRVSDHKPDGTPVGNPAVCRTLFELRFRTMQGARG